MQFDIPEFNDPVAALRDDVKSYLARNNVKQKALASLAGTTEQTISDFLGKRERGLMAETFARLQFIVTNGVVPKSNRIVNAQRFGQPVEDLTVDIAEFEAEHTKTHLDCIQNSRRNHNANTIFSGKE
jgi:hypothetical protein